MEAKSEETNRDTLQARLAELERRVLGNPRHAAEDGVPLTVCNKRAIEVAEAERKKRVSAAAIAKSAIDKAFNPTERQRKSEAKLQKPVTGVAAEMTAKQVSKKS